MLDLTTVRLRLTPCSVAMAQAATTDRGALAAMVGMHVPDRWPQEDLRDFLPVYGQIVSDELALAGWGIWLMLAPAAQTLVGDIGFKGPPDDRGMVEIGYSVLPAFRARGYASEAAQALVAWALAQPDVRRVTAECLADNAASIRVLEKIGMRQTGQTDQLLKWKL